MILKIQSLEAIGLVTYSNSKSTVLSYVLMFETLWLQTKLSDLLKIQDKMQKEFINSAAHELRTPIQPILALSELLYSQIENKEQRKGLEVIIRNAERLQRLTNDILDVAIIETGTLQIKKERFNLYDLISNLISHYKTICSRNIETKNVKFLYIAEEQNLTIEADKRLLCQVLDDPLSNAIKFTKRIDDDDTAIITITTKRGERNDNNKNNNNNIIVSVKDNGTGINEEILPNMFSKFTTKSFEGLGLELYISKHIVEAHGGKIWAKNNKDGKGATFRFTLPIS